MEQPELENQNNQNLAGRQAEGNSHQPVKIQPPHEFNNLDKVRDILFGDRVRDIDTRFARLEDKLIKECASLRDETRSRLDVLENYIKQEVESLTNRIQTEYGDRDRAVKSLQEETQTIKSGLEERISQAQENANNSHRELREQVFNQSKTLQDAIQQKYEEIIALIERESKDLRHQKTDRSALAALLNELAIRLNSQ